MSDEEKPKATQQANVLPASGVHSISTDYLRTAWRVTDFEAVIEIVFSRLDLPAVALANEKKLGDFIPQIGIRMNLHLAKYLAAVILDNFRRMRPEDLKKHGFDISDLPDWPKPEGKRDG